ncbi:MAG: hypothetical protein QME81_16545, partial [bacterium]|nr:hypothetical protein [bacterium]
DDNFFRYSFPLSDSSDDFEELSRQGLINITDIKGESTWNFPREEWRRVIIDFDRLRTLMQNIADSGGFSLGNSSFDYNSGGIVIKGKKPSLKDIKHLKLIVENKSASPASGEIWINEIHLRELSQAVTDPTMAVRFNIKGGFTDWATINWDSNYLGAHFESIGGPAESPQKKVTNNLSGTVGRLKFVPLDLSWSQTKSATDAKRVIDVTGANIDETLAGSKTVGFLFTPNQIPGLNPDSRLLKLIPALSKTTYTQADNTTFERTTGEKKGTGSTKTLTGGKISFPLKWMPAINRTGYTRTEGDRLKWDTGRPENTNWSKKMDGEISFPFKNWTSTLLNRAPFLSVIPGQLAGDITFSTTYNKTEQTEYSDTGEEKTKTEEKNLTRNGIFPKYTYSYNYTFPKRLLSIPTGHSLSFGTNHNYGFDYKYQEKGKTVNGVTSDTIDQTDQTVTGSQSFTFKFSPVASLSSNFSLDLSQNYVDSTRRNQGFEAFKHGVNFKFGTNIPFIPDLNPSFNCDGSYDETYSDPRTADPNNRKKDAVNTLTNLTFSTNQINPANWWNKLKVLNGKYTYKLLMKAAYKDMPDTVGLWSDLAHVYKDYYRGRFLPIDGTTDELSGYRNSGSITRNHILTTNWDPGIKRITGCSLTGDSKRIETDSIGTGTTQHNDSLNGSLSLDVLSWVKRFPYRFKDVSSSSVTPSYKWSEDKKFSRQALTSHSISNTPSLEWKLVWPNKLSVTTNINRPKTEDRSTKKTTVTTSYSCAGSHSTTIKKPGVVKIPVFAPMNFKNDINLTSNLGWKRATNETNGVTDASADDYSLMVSGNYNVQTNANGTLKLTGKYHNNRKNSSESYYGLQLFLVFNINFK